MPLDVPALGDDVVALRPPTHDDVDAIAAACQDPEIGWFTRVPSPHVQADAVEYIGRAADDWANRSTASFVITDAEGAALLGSVRLMRLDDDRKVAEASRRARSDW